jgi:hypothetical protein
VLAGAASATDPRRCDYFKPDFFNDIGQIEPSREQRAERQMSDSKAALGSRSLTMGPFEPGSQSQQSVWGMIENRRPSVATAFVARSFEGAVQPSSASSETTFHQSVASRSPENK